jgi:succinyl-CoA synthetase alpha subunit
MSILVDKTTKVIVQGITGREGLFHAKAMADYGTQVVGGTSPGKGGAKADGFPVFNTVEQAANETGANASVILVPAFAAADAVCESVDAGLDVIVCVTEGIPIIDAMKAYSYVFQSTSTLIGPNCPGLITAGQAKLGIMPGHIFEPGPVGLISRSGTLTYEIVDNLTKAGLGQTTCVGIGGDPIIGTTFVDMLQMFEDDDETNVVVLVGEIGGSDEELAAECISQMTKPVVGFISGRTAPKGKRMGHAGAIVSGNKGTAESKVEAFLKHGVLLANTVPEIVELTKKALDR